MSDYLLLFRGLAARPDADDPTTIDYNRQWGRWMGELAVTGKLVGGGPLEPRGVVVGHEAARPLELEPVDIGGYLLIRADSDDEAATIAGQAPHAALGGTTIVRPVAAVGG